MHHRAVPGHHKVGAAPLHLLQHGQAAPAGAALLAQDAHIASAVAHERKVVGAQVGDDDLARLARGGGRAIGPHSLDHDVLSADVQAARRALVRNKAGIAGAVAIGHRAAEDARQGAALLVVQPLGRDEHHPDAEVVEPDAQALSLAGDQRQAGRIAKQHGRPLLPDAGNKAVDLARRHLKRRQQMAAQQAVAQPPHAVLRAELDRAAPDHQLFVADIHAPPPGGAPLGRHIVAFAGQAHVKDQRFTRRSAGIAACQRAVRLGFEQLGIGPDIGLGQQWQRLQVSGAAAGGRVEAQRFEQGLVVRHAAADAAQKIAQAAVSVSGNLLGRPPLAGFQPLPQFDRAMAFGPLVQRENDICTELGVEAHALALASIFRIRPALDGRMQQRALMAFAASPKSSRANSARH